MFKQIEYPTCAQSTGNILKHLKVDNYLLIRNLVNDFKIKNPIEYQNLFAEFPDLNIDFWDTPRCFMISIKNREISFSTNLLSNGITDMFLCNHRFGLIKQSIYNERIAYETTQGISMRTMYKDISVFLDGILVPLLGMKYTINYYYSRISFKNPKFVKVPEIKFQWFKT